MNSKKLIQWTKKNRREFLLILAILVLAIFLRFYRLADYMQFLGDQGRDAIIVKQILVNHHFPAIGPPSSVGSVYLGPLYYYMMAVVMLIFYLNPVAAAAMIALIGVLTTFLIYYLSRQWFGPKAGLVSAFLYSISPVAINYARFSWNPNPVPFFTLLAFLGLYQAHKSGNFKWFILSGVSLAAVLQMHYLTLILLPIFGLLWLNELRIFWRYKGERRYFWWGTMLSVILFLVIMSPLLIFDLRHNFMNFKGLVQLFSGRDSGVNLSLAGSFSRLPDIFINSFIGRYLAGNNTILAGIIAILIFIPIVRRLYLYAKKGQMSWVILTLSLWLFLGFLGLMFYKGPIYDHYLAFLSPIPFILLGAISELDLDLKGFKFFKVVVMVIVLAVLTFFNLSINPLLSPPNQQLQKTQAIDKFIINASQNQPFNFALLSANNYDSAYQFYFDIFGDKALPVPAQKTSQLFVVCEDATCQPVGNPKYEIAAFGWTTQAWEQDFDSVKIFKLVPNPAQGTR